MKIDWKREIFPVAVLIIVAATAFYYYPSLPDRVPSHFNIHGNADGWMNKNAFFLAIGLTFILIYFLLTFLPLIDPFRKKIEKRFNIILILRDMLIGLFAVIFLLSLKAAYDGHLQMNLFGIVFGVVLTVLGNYMPRLPQNWFIGIRTPWSITSESNWKKTNIVGGWLFALSGIAFIVCAILNFSDIIPFAAVLLAAFGGVIYSFYLFKKSENKIGSAG